MSDPWSVLLFLGSSICHQIPERSYFLGDLQMPLCARCIGIHFGFILSAAFLMLGPKRYCSIMLRPRQLTVLGIVMAFYMIDVGMSYSGVSTSDNIRRTLSGLALGVPIPFFLIPFVNSFLYPNRNGVSPIETKADWLWLPILYVLGAVAILLADRHGLLFFFVSVTGIIGMVSFFSTGASLVALLGFDRSRIPAGRRVLAGTTAVIAVLLLVATVRQLLFG
ncbi:MAG: hypothetical protein A3K76_00955 [Euryarchaeota archaeon RBG_13_57_23]|nr:MAG: hypothetical protein A3K76_00955 [Euryarchaeota archaeon RBG_13_57_23]